MNQTECKYTKRELLLQGLFFWAFIFSPTVVGYGLYLKRKEKLDREQEVIDITPEIPFEEEDTRK